MSAENPKVLCQKQIHVQKVNENSSTGARKNLTREKILSKKKLNKRNDKRFNDRTYLLLYLMAIFLKHLSETSFLKH